MHIRIAILISIVHMTLNLTLAQEQLNLSLDEALSLAILNSPEIRSQEVDLKLANRANEKIKAMRRPQISGDADFRLNTQLQSTVLPFDITGQDPEGSSTVRFGTRFQNALTLQLDQSILDPAKKIQWEINNNRTAEKKEQLHQIQIAIKEEVINTYYEAVYLREKIAFGEEDLDQAQFNLSVGNTKYQQGTMVQNEWLKLQIKVTTAQLNLEKLQNQFALKLIELKELLRVDPGTSIVVTDSTTMLKARIMAENTGIADRPEIRRLKLNESYANLQDQLALTDRKISLDGFAHYGLLQLNDQFNPVNTDTWFPYNYLGVRLRVPISDGKLAKLNAQDQQLLKEKILIELDDIQYQIQQQELHARQKLLFTQKSLTLAQNNLELAKEIYSNDQLSFQKGVLLPAELRSSEEEINRAKNNYLDALYDLLLADLELRTTLGIF